MTNLADGTYKLDLDGHWIAADHAEGYYVAHINRDVEAHIVSRPIKDGVLDRIRLELLRDSGCLLGVWTNPATGYVHLDVTCHYASYNVALQVSRDQHQICFWDIANHCAIASSAPFRAVLNGVCGISTLSQRAAEDLARGTIAKRNQEVIR